ncbi:hypothetical protein AVEN_233554-1 [Araneus ventricosus]|uniref:Histone-lysine N-methyltransferase SETMAR n=1 Tax=Araneus ventricosus TaxID=182803 RepID=A0A4Y2LM44_ARAVE|nr:hypothetical protein AVEN_233554-1 [Araneus ventricosus]
MDPAGREIQIRDFALNVVIISSSSSDENRLGPDLADQTKQPDLAPSYFHLFSPLKQHLGGIHFADDDDILDEVLLWTRQETKEFYAAGIGALIKRWDKCINLGGDYVEK